jgi:CDP-diacylglycerol--glycerol-3-phosphate 3-phosphatidyltransferase
MMTMAKSYIPNILTLLRGVAALVIFVLFFVPGQHVVAIYWLFLFAVLTDYPDGYLARRWGTVSDFGVVFDPLCDKVLVLGLILLIFPLYIVWAPLLLILFLRDIVTDVFKNYLLSHGVKTPAVYSAKLKTTMQMAMLHFVLLYIIFPFALIGVIANICAIAATVFSLYSGAIYTRRFINFMMRPNISSSK